MRDGGGTKSDGLGRTPHVELTVRQVVRVVVGLWVASHITHGEVARAAGG